MTRDELIERWCAALWDHPSVARPAPWHETSEENWHKTALRENVRNALETAATPEQYLSAVRPGWHMVRDDYPTTRYAAPPEEPKP